MTVSARETDSRNMHGVRAGRRRGRRYSRIAAPAGGLAAVAVLLGMAAPGYAQARANLDAEQAEQAEQAEHSSEKLGSRMGTNGAGVPELDWGSCPKDAFAPGQPREEYECATAEVPLSYRNPDGRQIEIAVGRLPAKDQSNKIGTIFSNPGGPGQPGRIPPTVTPELREHFDLVGFDPRGIGASTPVSCFTSPEQAKTTFGRPFPITDKQRQAYVEATERGTKLCEQNAGPIISHMSTANVARDMDLLRRAVGERKMNYLGQSYGTYVGQVYANLFPDTVRAMTLDGVMDPIQWSTGETLAEALLEPYSYRVGSHKGTQQALESFFAACAAEPGCAFDQSDDGEGDDGKRALQDTYESTMDRLRDEPVTITIAGTDGKTMKMTYQTALGMVLAQLYNAQDAPQLARFLQELDKATRSESAPVMHLSKVPTPPSPEWLGAVACTDSVGPEHEGLWRLAAKRADRQAPGFGTLWTYASLKCATWPAQDKDRYLGPWDQQTQAPVLVVGNGQGDPSTPYASARAVAQRIDNARLLTLNTWGHKSVLGKSTCVEQSVSRYFIEAELPPKGTVCQPDRSPFATNG